jgi:hypothetical protein
MLRLSRFLAKTEGFQNLRSNVLSKTQEIDEGFDKLFNKTEDNVQNSAQNDPNSKVSIK